MVALPVALFERPILAVPLHLGLAELSAEAVNERRDPRVPQAQDEPVARTELRRRTSALLALDLKAKKLEFAWLTGATTDRRSEVERFQSGQVKVFLISLKAGGIGLTLTAADHVIHYDPWWNPAVEAQATDRARRIGQDKPRG